MKWPLLLALSSLLVADPPEIDFTDWLPQGDAIVVDHFQIVLPDFPHAHNPSLFETDQGYLLTFRHSLDNDPSISYIGIALLNPSFALMAPPQLLSTRTKESGVPSHSEDARIFSYRKRLFLVYNDNAELVHPTTGDRRDMFLSQLFYDQGKFSLSPPLKLLSAAHYNESLWQKNWVPFEWNQTLLFSYTLAPHEVLHPNLKDGMCYLFHQTHSPLTWDYGILRGGTPALLVDGEYLAFFHSGIVASSEASHSIDLWHYFMGAYTFSPSPPFALTKMTPHPICATGFYTSSYREKRVIFPGGFVVKGPKIYLAYGKDDCEIWIATLDKEALKQALKPLQPK